jgi:uncharacterized protein
MQIERKFIDLKSLKMSDEDPGSIEGYRSVFGEIDDGGDIVVKGAFADCLDEYLSSGFSAHSHDWKFTEAVGYPVEAKEDDYGWFVKSVFHTTQTAQDARTIASERKKAGKKVGFSFGYIPVEFDYIDAKDFKEKIPLYVKSDRLDLNLAKAQKFNRIRLLKKVEAPEDSLVLAGMNKLAGATAVKDNLKIEIVDEEETKTIRKCKPEDTESGKPWCLYSSDGSKLLGRHATREECVAQEAAIEANKGESVADSFESFDDVVAALEKHTHNMQRNHENRVKEGRVLSGSNRAKVLAARDALDDLLAASEMAPKEKEVDVDALRTQSLRMQSLAIRALA